MSYRLTAAAISADVANAPQKMVLVVLADIADDAGKCWPSLGLIAKRAAMSRKSVIDQIPKLEAAGHLTVRRDGKHNVYRVHPAGSVTHSDQTSHRRLLVTDGDQSPTVTTTVTHSDHHQSLTVTPLVTDGDPNQSLNQSINQSMNQPSTPPAAKVEEVRPEKEKRVKPGPEPEACAMTLPGNPSAELAEAWEEWQQYRQRRAIAPGRQRVAWTAQAARLSAKQVTQYAASHGGRIVCDRIASAINGEWQGLNLDKLDAPGGRSGKMSYEEEARIHKPNPNSEYGF
jgi:hypothetical protein